MPRNVEVNVGQKFQDGTGLTVKVGEIDSNDRVQFSVISNHQGADRPGEMSYSVFVNRFTRIDSAEDACVRIKRLGYVAFRRVRIYGEEFELLSDPFPERDWIAIRARAKGQPGIRVLHLPVTIVQSAGARTTKAA